MVKKVVALLLILLLVVSVMYSIFLYQQNVKLGNENSILKEEITTLESANIVTALGVVEIPPYGESYWGGNGNFSYLWITGWVLNSGGSMAKKAGLDVLAFDEANTVLLNYTVPITEGGIGAFSTNETLRNLIPYYLYPTPLEFGNVLSQQNVTVRLAIFHEGIFPNSTRFEINPVWENVQ